MDWGSILLDMGIDTPSDRDEFQIPCPFHDDSRPSCSINVEKGMWICFRGCGQGSLKSFIGQYLNFNSEEVEQYLLKNGIQIELCSFDGFEVEDGDLDEVEIPYQKGYVPDWIFERGFNKQTLLEWECGIDTYRNLVIPIHDKSSREVGWVTRQYKQEPKYLYSKGLKKSKVLFGSHKITKCDFVCITEGTLDTMWLNQNGFNSVALLGAHMSKIQEELLVKLPTNELVLCLDNDEAGQMGSEKISTCISKRFVVSYTQLPTEYKDVQDIRNKEQLQQIINTRTFW